MTRTLPRHARGAAPETCPPSELRATRAGAAQTPAGPPSIGPMSDAGLEQARRKMQEAGVDPVAIDVF
ncbi:MAG TPA: hypothetical protein VLB03_11375, partial [Nocardioidaceae bacterium]|nr:hypothetical protein [Nocardioidaceae bacterium]